MRKSTIIGLLGISFLLTNTIMMFGIFTKAYLHDSKSATVFINDYGEANIEMLLFIVFMPLAVIAFNEYIHLLARREASES